MSGTRIAVLAAIISTNTTKIDDYLKSHGLPPPSFHVDHPADLCIPPDAIDIDKARKVTLEASIELQDLLQGPTSLLQPAVCYSTAKCSVSPTSSPLITKRFILKWTFTVERNKSSSNLQIRNCL